MQLTQTQLLPLSQAKLNLLEVCPRKFQHVYLEQLGSPTGPEQQERLIWGSRFHLLMQQRELGLPVEPLLGEDAQLKRWVTALAIAAPEILTPNPNTFRQAEDCRTLNFQGYLLTVIYDLSIASEKQAQILDWKTYLIPRNRQQLEQDWQTRLYLYVMAERSDYLPEQISMTYWFVQSQPEPQSLKFTYNAAQHERSRQDLTRLLTLLSGWLQCYEETGADFPQVAEASRHCNNCNFAVRCERSPQSQESALDRNLLPNIADIEEVSL